MYGNFGVSVLVASWGLYVKYKVLWLLYCVPHLMLLVRLTSLPQYCVQFCPIFCVVFIPKAFVLIVFIT